MSAILFSIFSVLIAAKSSPSVLVTIVVLSPHGKRISWQVFERPEEVLELVDKIRTDQGFD